MPKVNALALVAGIFAAILAPPVPIAPSAWAKANLIVPDGPRAGELWDASLTPYIIEPLDNFGPDSGINEQAIMKSAQSGFTLLAIAAIGHSIDCAPCRMMVVQPTDSALSDFNRDKLQPAIDASKALAGKVEPQASRSGAGSTTYSKRYPGGSLTLALASSSADLRSKTIKYLLRDEIDEYPDDLDGQGDPLLLSDGRQLSYLASGDWRKLDISTPTVKGGSKIEARYEAGDQRRWHVTCPHCKTTAGDPSEFVFEWGESLRYDRAWPHNAHYVAPCCGSIIAAHEKNTLMRGGRWIAGAARPGAYPSYHIDALSSPFVPWDETVKAFLAAGDDQARLKTFWNLWLGLPYEIKGDAPDHVRLMERRESGLKRGHVPPRGLLLVASADVQMRGLWCEIKAFAPNRESWVVDAFYCDGDTASPDSPAFAELIAKTLDRSFPDAFGGARKLDALAIDSGYRSHVVYSVVRRTQRPHQDTGRDMVLAVKGLEGWGRPAIGQPVLVDISLDGRKIKKGAKVWGVGTWPLKGAVYANLRKEGRKAGAEADPPGYCHFPDWLDEVYFRQLTAEHLVEEKKRGVLKRVWKIRASEKDNHFLDCAIYNEALIESLGFSTIPQDEWAGLARRRGMPAAAIEANLFTAPALTEADRVSPLAAPPAVVAPAAAAEDAFARLARFNAGETGEGAA